MSHTHAGPDHESPPSMPHWVKVFGIVIVVLVIAFITMHLMGGGFGPGSHMPAMDHSVQQP